jgi:hypothetical protein
LIKYVAESIPSDFCDVADDAGAGIFSVGICVGQNYFRHRRNRRRDFGHYLRSLFFEKIEKNQLPMKTLRKIFIGALAFTPAPLFACAACGSENPNGPACPLADGMNVGILTLLGILVPVLGCFAFGIIHMINKDEAAQKNNAAKNITDL